MIATLLLWTVYFIVFGFLFTVSLFVSTSIINRIAGKRYIKFKKYGWTRAFIRTPDEHFENLTDYNFSPHYVDIQGLRIHYVDEGPPDADPILLMHGEPSWSYLYRKMIPPLVKAGHRVIAPDLIGFGRSDKLLSRMDYCYQMHVDMVTDFIKKLDLQNISLFCQDWGGLIGLRVAAENQERYARIIAANTALPGKPPKTSDGKTPQLLPAKSFAGFIGWLLFSQLAPKFSAGQVLQFGTVTKLSPDVVAAYDAPYPNKFYLAGARAFPALVPSQMKENTLAWELLSKFEKPFLTAFSDKDPVLGGGDSVFHKVVPGAKGQPHTTTRDASHFLQEDKGEELADLLLKFVSTS